MNHNKPYQQNNFNKGNSFNKNNNFNKNHSNNHYSNNNNNSDEIERIKSYLLDYLYNKMEVGEHKYTLIKNISDVYDMKNKKYYCSGNSCGINSFIIFLKKDDEYYSYWIDRRSISYNKQTLKKSTVRISKIKLAVDLKFYDGTILDGILIDNNNTIVSNNISGENQKINFMITDVFTFCGKSLITLDYKKKMYTVNFMFSKMIQEDKSNNVNIFINRPFEINQIESLFKDYIEPNVKNYNIKGVSFYPQYSGNKLIYIFDKEDDEFKNNLLSGKPILDYNEEKNDDDYEYSDKKRIFKFELSNPEYIDDIIMNFEMRKTNTPDVYKLYGIFSSKNSNSKDIKYIKKRIGCAYIPTYILSLKCSSYFINKDTAIISCLFNTNKNKWIPIEEASVQKIDIINNDKRIKVYEQEVVIDNDYGNNDD
jgi:hypothetical protein